MSNRAAKYEQLHKALKKHFKASPEPGERTVLEHLVYACCLEDAKSEQADEAFAKLQQAYFDWNEVRVTTVIELGEALSSLHNATHAGHRIKRCLQSLFEARYQYDIDDLKKANLTKATEEISAWKGMTPFVLNYVSQNALGGHAIPADSLTLEVLVQCEVLTQAEADKKSLPGVERAIPKNKGFEFGSLLHQFAVDFQQSPKNVGVVAVFKELGVSPKAKVVEKPAPKKGVKSTLVEAPVESPAASPSKTKSADAGSLSTKSSSKASPMAESQASKKSEKEPVPPAKLKSTPSATVSGKVAETKKKGEPASAEVKKSETKKPDTKKIDGKKPEAKTTGKIAAEKHATKKIEPKTKDKKETPPTKAAPSKAVQPVPLAKKSTPVKKTEPPKTASKSVSNSTSAKKKPR